MITTKTQSIFKQLKSRICGGRKGASKSASKYGTVVSSEIMGPGEAVAEEDTHVLQVKAKRFTSAAKDSRRTNGENHSEEDSSYRPPPQLEESIEHDNSLKHSEPQASSDIDQSKGKKVQTRSQQDPS